MTAALPARVRPYRPDDLAALGRIYAHYVRSSPATFDVQPREGRVLEAWASAFAAAGPHRLLVAADRDRVHGYACSHPFRVRPAYARSVEVSVYLAPESRGRGLGARLLRALLDALAGEEVHRAYAGITRPNPASEALATHLGFRLVGVMGEVGHKLGRYWDVALYERAIDGRGTETAGPDVQLASGRGRP